MKSIDAKREQEKRVVSQMVHLYCRKQHHRPDLCPDCREVLAYAIDRSDHCPFMESKTFCSNCKVHCYRPEMRKKIKEIMRFSGPRMLLYHPVLAVSHMLLTVKERMRKT